MCFGPAQHCHNPSTKAKAALYRAKGEMQMLKNELQVNVSFLA